MKKKPNKNRSPERFDHNSRERSDVNWTEINSASRYNYDSVAVELCSGLMASMWWRAARCECSIDYAHNKFSSIQEAVRWRSLKRMCELNDKIFKCAKVCECKCSNNRICWCWCSLKNNTLRVSRMSVVRFGRILDNRKKNVYSALTSLRNSHFLAEYCNFTLTCGQKICTRNRLKRLESARLLRCLWGLNSFKEFVKTMVFGQCPPNNRCVFDDGKNLNGTAHMNGSREK